MKKTTTKKKTNKKLLSAFGMFMLSGAMLGSATYAWFTMSREVEVKNIQLTASAPVNVQLSLGDNMYKAMTDGSAKLTAIGSNDGVGLVKAPANNDTTKDWASTVSFYDFYQAPVLTPASSVDGASIFTTNDMTGVGRTITTGSGTSELGSGATLSLITQRTTVEPSSGTTPNYKTNNYIDFPVWFRTSSSSNVQLSVKATTMVGDNNSAKGHESGATPALYKAARVSILTGTSQNASAGVIIPFDGTTAQDTTKYYSSGTAINAAGGISSDGTEGSRTGAYGTVDAVTQETGSGTSSGEAVITIPGFGQTVSDNYTGNSAKDSNVYGDAVCVTIRVWLEGEDTDCWNATEGQDFKVNLTFYDKSNFGN